MHNIVPRLSATPGALRRPAPALGEHNEELLRALGYDAKAIDDLLLAGVLNSSGCPPPLETRAAL